MIASGLVGLTGTLVLFARVRQEARRIGGKKERMMADESSKTRASERRKAVLEAIKKLTQQADPTPSGRFGTQDPAAHKSGQEAAKQNGMHSDGEPR